MTRTAARSLAVFLLTAAPAVAQVQDSRFSDYATYDAFVNEVLEDGRYIDLVTTLGGRDEYTTEQLQGLESTLKRVFPDGFIGHTVFGREDLGGGVSQEGRIYWSETSFFYYYALLLERADDLVVMHFSFDNDPMKIMSKF